MPLKGKSKVRARRARPRSKRSYRRRGRITAIQPSTQPIANRFLTKLKYVDVLDLTFDSNGVANRQWRLNSLFDPDYTGVGKQPYGYDQLGTIYTLYRVFAAKVRFTLLDIEEDETTAALYMGIYNSTTVDALAARASAGILEMPYCKYKVTSANTIAGGISRSIRQNINIPKVLGVRSSQYKNDDYYWGDMAANPQSIAFMNTFILDPTQARAGKDVKVGVEIIFMAEMLYPKVLPSS